MTKAEIRKARKAARAAKQQLSQPRREKESYMPETATAPRLLSRVEAMSYIGLCSTSLWQLEKAGEIPSVRLGKRVLFDRADLDAFIDRKKTRARAQA